MAIPTTTPEDLFAEWKLSWMVTLTFQRRLKYPWTCLGCGSAHAGSAQRYCSEFLRLAVYCPEGHTPHLDRSKALCTECEMDMVLNVTKGLLTCFQPGCAKKLSV